METSRVRFFSRNWQKRAIALFAAIFIWILVNQSIIDTRTIPNVPIRVIHLPKHQTILGIQPNNYLKNRITLTLSGSRDVIHAIGQGDIEVHLDASVAESEDWVVNLSKQNLTSLNPNIDLSHHITHVEHPDLVIKLSEQIKEKIPVYIETPSGSSPPGYHFLDIWPKKLMQTVTGPKEEIEKLKHRGLKFTFDLNQVPKSSLDRLINPKREQRGDELTLHIPPKWRKVSYPHEKNQVELNDPMAKQIRLGFLKDDLHPIGKAIPLLVYYPLKTSSELNPELTTLIPNDEVVLSHQLAYYVAPLYIKNVSRRFLDVIQENLTIVIIAATKEEREALHWSAEVIDHPELENTYVALTLSDWSQDDETMRDIDELELLLRNRFRRYIEQVTLYTEDGSPLQLSATIDNNQLRVKNLR